MHPDVRTANGLVPSQVCKVCSYSEERNLARGAGEADDSRRPGFSGPKDRSVLRWSLGITTAPREIPTLSTCLDRLKLAGWSQPRVFSEPGVELPRRWSHLSVSKRDARLGAFPNWYLGLAELLMRDPEADAYFMIQDDAVLASNARRYLEQALWPERKVGVVSAYCPAASSRDRAAGFHAIRDGWKSWGALAYIFPREAARAILSDRVVLDHRFEGPHGGLRNIDSVVGSWCERADRNYFIHVPSLVQHVGATSTLYPGAAATGNRRAAAFIDDARDLMPGPNGPDGQSHVPGGSHPAQSK